MAKQWPKWAAAAKNMADAIMAMGRPMGILSKGGHAGGAFALQSRHREQRTVMVRGFFAPSQVGE